jgi:hypothetical protein
MNCAISPQWTTALVSLGKPCPEFEVCVFVAFVHLVDIDLRWSVARKQADDDRALHLCLQQIDDCQLLIVRMTLAWHVSSRDARQASASVHGEHGLQPGRSE